MASMHANEQSLQAQIEALMAENAKLKAAKQGKLSLKVSEKGALSVYGMGKWPVTLYRGQWERLLASKDQIEAFIELNSAQLTTKD
jgi:hypothetical protein